MSTFIKLEIPYISLLKQEELLPIVSQWNHAGHYSQHSKNWILYFEEKNFQEKDITDLLNEETIPYTWKVETFKLDPGLHWNGMFQPVLFNKYCFIRTPIHPKDVANCKHEITITPALSFGMGHHITTKLMLEFMEDLDFKNEVVLDAGTGTGILGIIALKEAAKKVIAIDINPFSVKNATYNAKQNDVALVAKHATITELKENSEAQYILSNISTPVHLATISDYYFHLKPGGILILSGVLDTDLPKIDKAYKASGFTFLKVINKAGWLAVSYRKK